MKDARLPIGRSILLHICCAPCLVYPFEFLKSEGFNLTGFFYNPNIYPPLEYNLRREGISVFNPGIEVIYPKYLPEEFTQAINSNEEAPKRCAICWRLRLAKTAAAARDKGFRYFSTTLLVSPYQDHDLIKEIGNDLAKESGVEFYYADFRKGFRKAREEARGKGIYMQKYCGCAFSVAERERRKIKCAS
jgi:predicted adenine nucleotide alpha hydrolase (AANH) superfamily ATPase